MAVNEPQSPGVDDATASKVGDSTCLGARLCSIDVATLLEFELQPGIDIWAFEHRIRHGAGPPGPYNACMWQDVVTMR